MRELYYSETGVVSGGIATVAGGIIGLGLGSLIGMVLDNDSANADVSYTAIGAGLGGLFGGAAGLLVDTVTAVAVGIGVGITIGITVAAAAAAAAAIGLGAIGLGAIGLGAIGLGAIGVGAACCLILI